MKDKNKKLLIKNEYENRSSKSIERNNKKLSIVNKNDNELQWE